MRGLKWGVVTLVLSALVVQLIALPAAAWNWNYYTSSGKRASYFHQYAYTSPSKQIIAGGLTGTSLDTFSGNAYGCDNNCATPADFVNFIWDKYNGTSGRVIDKAQDYAGASFIISATLNKPQNGSKGHDAVTVADFNTWKSLVMSSGVTMQATNITFTRHTGGHDFGGTWDAQWWDTSAITVKGLKFKKPDGTVWFQIENQCGNLADNPSSPPNPKSWTMTTNSTVTKSVIHPGETVNFNYYLHNNGPSTVDGSADGVWYTIWQRINGTPSQYIGGKAFSGTITSSNNAQVTPTNDSYTPTAADIGKEYCREVRAVPAYYGGGASDYTPDNWACLTVESDYDVYPVVSYGGGDLTPLSPGDKATMSQLVTNIASAADKTSHYEIQQFVVPAGAAKPNWAGVFSGSTAGHRFTTGPHANDAACTAWLTGKYGAGTITNCSNKGSGDQAFPANDFPLTVSAINADINADDYSPGDWVCRIISVSLYAYTVPTGSLDHRISYPVCVVIAKRPTMQVWGHDVRAGDGYILSMLNNDASVRTTRMYSSVADKTYGSWAEYGIFAPSNGIVQSASGGALSGKDGRLGTVSDAQANSLTFANTGVASGYGRWAPPSVLDSLLAAANRLPKITDIDQASVQLQSGLISIGLGEVKVVPLHAPAGQTSVKLSGEAPKGAGTIIVSDATVVIDNDIRINSQSQSITGLGVASQVVIIAPKIIIQNNVENIDAWLVAVPTGLATDDGIISTCDAITVPYFSGLRLNDDCSKHPLRINGAVFAREVQFRRTYGGGKGNLMVPAEVINLRADAFMWGGGSNLSVAGGGTPITTTFTTELPPRF